MDVAVLRELYSKIFFFSSRRRHTRCSRDWSSDVCSSDLTYLVFDIYNDDFILQEGAKAGMLPESIEKEKKIGRLQRENFRHAYQSGAKLALASIPVSIRTVTMRSSLAK